MASMPPQPQLIMPNHMHHIDRNQMIPISGQRIEPNLNICYAPAPAIRSYGCQPPVAVSRMPPQIMANVAPNNLKMGHLINMKQEAGAKLRDNVAFDPSTNSYISKATLASVGQLQQMEAVPSPSFQHYPMGIPGIPISGPQNCVMPPHTYAANAMPTAAPTMAARSSSFDGSQSPRSNDSCSTQGVPDKSEVIDAAVTLSSLFGTFETPGLTAASDSGSESGSNSSGQTAFPSGKSDALGSPKPKSKAVCFSEVVMCFHLPINEAAKKLGVCHTVIKKICRKRGITRWPYRQIAALDKLINHCQQKILTESGGTEKLCANLANLKQKKEQYFRNTLQCCGAHEVDVKEVLRASQSY